MKMPAKSKDLIKVLEINGFIRYSKKGSHIKLKRGSESVIVPDSGSKDMSRMIALRVLKETNIWSTYNA